MASAHAVQFSRIIDSSLEHTIWKTLAPPKVFSFAWLAIQDRIWTAGRLTKHGFPNAGLFPSMQEGTRISGVLPPGSTCSRVNSTSKNSKYFQKILNKFVDDRVGVASMLDNFHIEWSRGVSSMKKQN